MSHSRVTAFTFTGSSRPMGPGDFIWLAALGSASRGATTAAAICACIDTIAAGQWSPSAQLVCDCLDEMARARHLSFCHDGNYNLFTITPQGSGILAMMLALPIERPTTPLGQVGTRLKLAFLDLAAADERRLHLTDLIAAHQEELDRRPDSCADCHAPGCFGRMWSTHHTETLRRDLELLQRMREMNDTRDSTRGDGCSAHGLRLNCISN
ncbi:hypothetical protein [Magnetospirillum sulfuroxidans]|uniref:Transcriptional regulator n=1 Tax=Magnetospirillum sulfuroxidans TaxID=611300 RepID=A0ABS5ICI9_9PROT|nr:hypothetical protein [Magnetospirillum sulfuroxidans]MBR9972141.1 hypothetical protein [Magnetospirillum sulfuroxidans]